MTTTRLATGDDGRPVLVKEGGAAREAEVLVAARHPGVVEVAAWLADEDRLVLRWVGSRTLADHRPVPAEAARIAASLAATVADLHVLGIRHGRITPSRVVLDVGGRPVLCGFGGAALAGEDGPTPADDVAGLGQVLRSLVGPDAELEPIPERRLGPLPRWGGALRRTLLTLADHATHDEPSRRPTARALAASLAALAPVPTDDVDARPSPRAALLAAWADRRRPRPGRPDRGADPEEGAGRSRVALAVAATGAGLVAFAVTSILREPASPSGPPAARPQAAAAVPPTAAACASLPADLPAVDHDGDGCPSPVRVEGGVVEVDGVRYGVGEPGDVLAVGDWDCDGTATVAAVRPSTGEVFVFDGWGELTVPAVTTVPGAAGAEEGRCAVVVVDAAGARTEVAA